MKIVVRKNSSEKIRSSFVDMAREIIGVLWISEEPRNLENTKLRSCSVTRRQNPRRSFVVVSSGLDLGRLTGYISGVGRNPGEMADALNKHWLK